MPEMPETKSGKSVQSENGSAARQRPDLQADINMDRDEETGELRQMPDLEANIVVDGDGDFAEPSLKAAHEVTSMGNPDVPGLKLDLAKASKKVLSTGSCFAGPFFHTMLSYRVATEGDGGNAFVMQLYKELHAVSKERAFCLPIGLEGEWPKWARLPAEEVREGAIKVYLDAMCLEDGEPWEAGSTGMGGFIGGVSSSIIIVPLLSWYDGNTGSIGGMKQINPPENDYVDNVLLELIVALELSESPDGQEATRLRRIMPLLMGEKDPGGRYGAFPFAKVSELSDSPSTATNSRAASILKRLGVSPSPDLMNRSVKGVVNQVLAMDGLQLSLEGSHSKALRAVAERIVQETRNQVLSGLDHFEESTRDLDKFAIGTPQGAEALAWLAENNLLQLGSVFAAEGVDSLRVIANMSQDDIEYFLAGGKFKSLTMRRSAVIEFNQAVSKLRKNILSKRISERLWMHEEGSAALGVAFFRQNGIEQTLATGKNTQIIFSAVVVGVSIIFCMIFYVGPTGRAIFDIGRWPVSDSYFIASTFFYLGSLLVFASYRSMVAGTSWQITPMVSGRIQIILCFAYAVLQIPGEFIQQYVEPVTWEESSWRQWRWRNVFMWQFPYYPMFRIQGRFLWVCGLICSLFLNVFQTIFLSFDSNKNDVVLYLYYCMCASVALNGVYWLVAMQFALYKAREQLSRASHIYVTMWNDFFGKGDNLVQARMLAQETRKDYESLEKERETLMAEDAKVWSLDRMLFWQWLLMLDFWMEKYRLKMNYHMRVSSKGKILQQTRDIDQLFGEAREIHWYFQDWVSGWDPEVRHIPGPVKNPARALQKCVRQYGREVRCLTDLVRCTVIAKDVEGALGFYHEVKRRCAPLGVTIDGAGSNTQMSSRFGSNLARVHDENPEDVNVDEHKSIKYDKKPRLLRLTKIRNRLDPDYDASESLGFRALALGVEVCWLRRRRGLTFLPVEEWGTPGSKRHICEIQILVEGAAITTEEDPALYQYYRDWRDLMFK